MPTNERRPAGDGAASEQSTATTTRIVARPGDGWQTRHVKALDRHLNPLAEFVHGWPAADVYRDGRLTVPGRQYRGEELRSRRWMP